ncbi:transcriptional regulator swi6 [Coniosporium apollinis]|uniref:Transcriptional regulator swi6 n=1 Tax=Coniosporium apollinis TaxID=61459 RepID=A0ABQ9NQS3_9PEZI|nr:transcriptional regulator swi6 [Coniosporium apollinis]
MKVAYNPVLEQAPQIIAHVNPDVISHNAPRKLVLKSLLSSAVLRSRLDAYAANKSSLLQKSQARKARSGELERQYRKLGMCASGKEDVYHDPGFRKARADHALRYLRVFKASLRPWCHTKRVPIREQYATAATKLQAVVASASAIIPEHGLWHTRSSGMPFNGQIPGGRHSRDCLFPADWLGDEILSYHDPQCWCLISKTMHSNESSSLVVALLRSTMDTIVRLRGTVKMRMTPTLHLLLMPLMGQTRT